MTPIAWQSAATPTCFVTFKPTRPQTKLTRNSHKLTATQATNPSIIAKLIWRLARPISVIMDQVDLYAQIKAAKRDSSQEQRFDISSPTIESVTIWFRS